MFDDRALKRDRVCCVRKGCQAGELTAGDLIPHGTAPDLPARRPRQGSTAYENDSIRHDAVAGFETRPHRIGYMAECRIGRSARDLNDDRNTFAARPVEADGRSAAGAPKRKGFRSRLEILGEY